MNIPELIERIYLGDATDKEIIGCIEELQAEVERLRKEFYLYEIEGTYKGNSIRHWYNKAQAYGTKMCEFKADNERLKEHLRHVITCRSDYGCGLCDNAFEDAGFGDELEGDDD